jgi:hypothetical protein
MHRPAKPKRLQKTGDAVRVIKQAALLLAKNLPEM